MFYIKSISVSHVVHVCLLRRIYVCVFCNPEEHMYMVVNKFLLGHQYLDFKRVPEFFKLFYSFDLEVSEGPL